MSSETEDRYVEKIIAETIERREAGEPLSDTDVIAAHPEHAKLLRINLERLRIISRAQQLTDVASSGETFTTDTIRAENPRTLNYCPACESRWKLSSGLTLCPTCGMELKPVSEDGPHPGQQIRHYVLVEQIGSGGFGTVWRAMDSKLECDVAIKIPRQEKLSTDEIERFIREARVSAQLRKHPNIVSVHEADWEDATAYIASDFIEGVSLGDRLEHSTIPREATVDLVMTICDALHHAHEAGIVHRDLKPDNILLDGKEVPHVTDFGLAKREDQLIASDVGQIMGTAAYMSPEQAKGASDQADRRSDVFSLGVVLYEMLTGERPFRGSVPRTLRQIIDQDPPRLTAFDSRIPLDLETICLKCLEKDPNLRYQTMEELKADLQRLQKHQPILARPISTVGRLLRWCKRNPVIPWLSLALILVTLGAMLAAGTLLNRYVATMQEEELQKTKQTLSLMNYYALTDARNTLDQRIEDVRKLVSNDSKYALPSALIEWNQIDWTTRAVPKDKVLENLRVHAKPEMIIDEFPEGLKKVQKSLIDSVGTLYSDLETFSWFVCDKDGYQISRVDPEKTLGDHFYYRSYFTGKKEYPETTPPQQVEQKWNGSTEPRISEVFSTKQSKSWVIAISAPIYDDQNKLQGVVGTFVELGKLMKLPVESQESDAIKISVYDAREKGIESAVPIHHSYFIESERDDDAQELEPEKLNEKTANLATKKGEESQFVGIVSYHDPFYDQDIQQEWLAIRNREAFRDGLYVVVQMPMSVIEAPGKHLRTSLILLGISVVGFSAAILIPMWIIILRRVIKE